MNHVEDVLAGALRENHVGRRLPGVIMSVDIPSDYGAIVQRLISEGKFQDEGEVVAEGIRLVIAREKLHADIQAGIDELDAGKGIDASEVYAEAKRRIQAIEERQS